MCEELNWDGTQGSFYTSWFCNKVLSFPSSRCSSLTAKRGKLVRLSHSRPGLGSSTGSILQAFQAAAWSSPEQPEPSSEKQFGLSNLLSSFLGLQKQRPNGANWFHCHGFLGGFARNTPQTFLYLFPLFVLQFQMNKCKWKTFYLIY